MHKDSEIKVDIYSDCLKNNDIKQVDLLKKKVFLQGITTKKFKLVLPESL